jgi:hypothetical protein
MAYILKTSSVSVKALKFTTLLTGAAIKSQLSIGISFDFRSYMAWRTPSSCRPCFVEKLPARPDKRLRCRSATAREPPINPLKSERLPREKPQRSRQRHASVLEIKSSSHPSLKQSWAGSRGIYDRISLCLCVCVSLIISQDR